MLAVAAGAVTHDRRAGFGLAGQVTATAWEHSGHLPEDVPLHELVEQFIAWRYMEGQQVPAWAAPRVPYAGPVEVGMRFTLHAGDLQQEALVDVTRIDDVDNGRRIWFRHADRRMLPEWERLDPNTRLVRTRYGAPCSEKLFRESAVPAVV